MTVVDWVALAFVAVLALAGMQRGLVSGALSLAGIAVGAVAGARLAPYLLSGGSQSRYTPLVALAGAAVLAVTFEAVGSLAGAAVRHRLLPGPLRAVDSAGGLALGAATALAIVWVLGAVALLVPGQVDLRRGAQRSLVLQELNAVLPPSTLLNTLARVDPFPAIAGPLARVDPPDPRVAGVPAVRSAAQSVVRVVGTACGLGVVGSGWVAAPNLVVTAAHVVAGQDDTQIEPPASSTALSAHAVAFDTTNDIAVLRVPDLSRPPLPLVDPTPGDAVAILGYPDNGPLTATPGRVGATTTVLSRDAYGNGPVLRRVTSLRGRVRHGNSGGPVVNARGHVEATAFAARVRRRGGYAVPADVVRRIVARARGPVSTGDCAR